MIRRMHCRLACQAGRIPVARHRYRTVIIRAAQRAEGDGCLPQSEMTPAPHGATRVQYRDQRGWRSRPSAPNLNELSAPMCTRTSVCSSLALESVAGVRNDGATAVARVTRSVDYLSCRLLAALLPLLAMLSLASQDVPLAAVHAAGSPSPLLLVTDSTNT